jgi:hypothetical protein
MLEEFEIAESFLNNCTNESVFDEFLVNCPIEDMSYLVTQLILKAT